MRASGILLSIASLPSRYGIGAFSKSAYQFIDKLKAAGQKYWQILPLGPTGYGDSPYQSFSTFAGNPYFIDLEALIEQGILTKEECDACDFGTDARYIDYEKLYESRFSLLKKAYQRSTFKDEADFLEFKAENAFWLKDYTLYMAVKNELEGKCWREWDEGIRLHKQDAISFYQDKLKDEIGFYEYLQFIFRQQWCQLKEYANSQGIKIIGDIPIYVALDSADAWSNPQLFQFDEQNTPIAVAGCPPDDFAATGQLWGNPVYKWDYHRNTGYDWWVKRIKYCCMLYDVVRIDHFRGFDEYYAIPYTHETAEKGSWEKGPGIELFKRVHQKLGDVKIIAEDLGFLTDSVKKMLKESGYPGMKVLEFAFDSRENNDYLPHTYNSNCVVYTGTHDNETLVSWYWNISEGDRKMAMQYLNNERTPKEEIHWDFIRLAQLSVAKLCIIPVQDYLGLGDEARINKPATIGGNWRWRLLEDELSEEIINKIREVTRISGRL